MSSKQNTELATIVLNLNINTIKNRMLLNIVLTHLSADPTLAEHAFLI